MLMGNTPPDIRPEELFSQYSPLGVAGRLFNFPLMRVIVIGLFFVPVMIFNAVVVMQVIEKLEEPVATYVDMARLLITIPVFILSYRLYCQTFEKRDAVEVGYRGAFGQWLTGAVISTGLVLAAVFLIARFGEFRIVEFRPALKLLSNFVLFSTGALFQEIVLLCVIYRLIEELTGSWIAIFGSLLIFAGLHLINEAETPGSALMLMLSSLILISPFILTRRIWLSWGFHAGW